jgi:hypothetical protein
MEKIEDFGLFWVVFVIVYAAALTSGIFIASYNSLKPMFS